MDKDHIKILLIEDDAEDYVIVRELLSAVKLADLSLEWVKTYQEGLKELRRADHDVYLLDYRLGSRNGLELIREATEAGCDKPIIFLTGQGDYEVDMGAMRSGAADYLVKAQLTTDLLERSIRYSIARKEAERELKSYWSRLEDLVTKRTEQLETANEELREKIVEGKQAEEALRQSEERYRHISGSISDFAYSCTKPVGGDYAIDWLVGAVESITGYATQEILDSRCWRFLVHPEDMAIFDKNVIGLEPGGSSQCELRIVNRDGSVRWIRAASRVAENIEALRPHRLFGSCEDITERKCAEEGLLETKELLSTFMRHSPFYVYIKEVTPTESRVLQASDNFQQMIGIPASEMIGKTMPELFPAEFAAKITAEDWAVVSSGAVLNLDENLNDRHYTTTKFPIVREGRTLLAGYTIDITESKHAREAREKLQAQLNQAQKMESVGRLAGGVAHDFNNMLGVILGHAEMAMDSLDPAHPLFSNLREIQKAAERSADLTRQLLAFARKQTVAPKVLDLNETVEGMLKMLRRLIGEDIGLAWLPGKNLWPVKVDPSQIDQILANLCVNARDAIAGAGKVTIETETITFDEDYCSQHEGFAPGEFVLLAVSDNGCGMDRETFGKLFEPFFTTKGVGKGTGLGLATVYGIVKQNNGFINVYSEPGQGTTFRIYMPRHAARAVEDPKTSAEVPKGRGETVLLVEDESAILDMTAKMLERQSYTVLAAGTPGEAIRLARAHPGEIHLLLTDVVMPEMNGRDLAKSILALYPNLKCLFMSGYTANVIAHHGVLDERVQFIQKPFSIQDLAVKVRKTLDE